MLLLLLVEWSCGAGDEHSYLAGEGRSGQGLDRGGDSNSTPALLTLGRPDRMGLFIASLT